ncbi:MAG TPA: Crp/Fnr family transcriptional regulator [Bdellovibrionota bacterium]|nr:Crp/Fnr family transcriptional regulator [Bdellovibrionota bacterium]
MASQGITDLLQGSDFFEGLSEPTLNAIARLCSTQILKKDQILFTEDSPGERIYLLASGMIQLFKQSGGGTSSLIHLVHPGDLFAEVVLFERETYPVTAIAAQKCSVVAIPRSGFLDLLDEKGAREEFLRLLMKKLRLLTRHIRRLTGDSLEARFFGFLEDHFGSQRVIRPQMTKKDMAAAMGITPEAFSRFLTKMKKTGRVNWEKDVIKLGK